MLHAPQSHPPTWPYQTLKLVVDVINRQVLPISSTQKTYFYFGLFYRVGYHRGSPFSHTTRGMNNRPVGGSGSETSHPVDMINLSVNQSINPVGQHVPTGDPQATSGPGLIRPAKLFVNLLVVVTSSLTSLARSIWKEYVYTSSAALRTSVTNATDLKTMTQNVCFPGKNFVRYKLSEKKI
jgi:hypothetical protein